MYSSRLLRILLVSVAVAPFSRSLPSLPRTGRIAGDIIEPNNKYHWQVSLKLWTTGRELEKDVPSCGGSVIGPRHVLTAAHCVTDNCGNVIQRAKAFFGAYNTCKKDWVEAQVIPAKNILVHPGYSSSTLLNDIAILQLPRQLPLGGKVRPVNLPPQQALAGCQLAQYDAEQLRQEREECTKNGLTEAYEENLPEDYEEEDEAEDEDDDEDDDEEYYDDEYPDYVPKSTFNCSTYYDNTWATVAGWGATFKSDSSCVLRAADTKIYPNRDKLCLEEEDDDVESLTEDRICAYNPEWETDTSCQGDSGSGLVVISNGSAPVLVGVVSYGANDNECGALNKAGIYARVQHFTSWIRSIIRN